MSVHLGCRWWRTVECFFRSVISWWEVNFGLYFSIWGCCLWLPREESWDFNAVAIRPNSSFKLFFSLFRESFFSWRDLALEVDFRVIISCQYFFPKAELTKARLHSTKTISVIDVNSKVPLQINWLPSNSYRVAIFSKTKLTSLVTHCFVITVKLPRWLHCILHCSYTSVCICVTKRMVGLMCNSTK